MIDRYFPTRPEQDAMADYITDAVVLDATGEMDGDRCVGEPPSAKYYLSSLAPIDLDLAAGALRRGRFAPNSAGFEFEVDEPAAVLSVAAGASCYYRVFPTYEEQVARSNRDLGGDERHDRTYELVPVFRRLGIDIGANEVQISDAHPVQYLFGDRFADAFARAIDEIRADPRVYRRVPDARREIELPDAALTSAEAFEAWLDGVQGEPVEPSWRAQIAVLARAVGERGRRVSVLFENLAADPVLTVVRREGPVNRHDDARDHFLFRIKLAVRAHHGGIRAMRMDLGADAYRYDPLFPAYATNIGVKADRTADVIDELRAVPAPWHTTYRTPSQQHPATALSRLATDPLPALEEIAADLAAFAEDPAWTTPPLPPGQEERRQSDRVACEQEVARFRDGVRWLRRDARLELAFKLANETMIDLGERTGRRFETWRLFQLVFIVSQLPALAWREHPPENFTPGLWGDPESADPTAAVTVLWFPTGQGKSEAYLGLTGCALFYDRLRAKTRGPTMWARFPLRLLSLQQTQRQLDFVVSADAVRERAANQIRAAGGDIGDPFVIGFYVGEGNTPNSLGGDESLVRALIDDPERRRKVRVVDRCPYCRARTIEIAPPDPTELRLRHVCMSCHRDIPVVIVDTEIYRYLPCVIVGTIDKLAMIGLSDKFGALLGDVDCECTLHGFGRGLKCHERRARTHPPRGTILPLRQPLHDPSPSLEIVDELHMIDEELGAFAGHYEGILTVTQEELSRRQRPDGRPVRMKVIATTATIKGEDRQCEHLFGRRSVVVPLPGPSLEDSFYWRVDQGNPLRRFVGILPLRITAEQTLARILQAFHRAVRRLQERGPAAIPALADMDPERFAALVDFYRVSLTYVTSLVDFGKAQRTIESQVNEFLRREGVAPVVKRELTAETPFEEVRRTLEDLERVHGETEAVLATSMVSHGVDIDRLNVMIFNGMPKSMAEYIQASSRVGRVNLGVVFMIYNPVRERDRSHFRYHAKFHEYLDRMVEPVAINRWSRYAARKTMPGVLMAEFLQIANREYWTRGRAPRHLHDLTHVKEAIRPVEQGGLESAQEPTLLDGLDRAYQFDRDGVVDLRDEVVADLHTALGSLRVAGAGAAAATRGRATYRGAPDYLGLRYEPMRSLRDVAEGLPFHLLGPDRRRE